MPRLKPFFSYYGSKYRLALKYPKPQFDLIVEPFAGSATYALAYPDKQVWLNDLNPTVCMVWEYLIAADAREIMSIPLVKTEEEVAALPPEQRALVGFWLGKALTKPATKPVGWLKEGKPLYDVQFWGESRRHRIASQVEHIKHWRITNLPYEEMQNVSATWFVDPPYDNRAGEAYVLGRKSIDYEYLAAWCRQRCGQAIVCENDSARWLPFKSLAKVKTVRKGRSTEVVWTSTDNSDLIGN